MKTVDTQTERMLQAMIGVACIASVMLDGDVVRRIITPRAMAHIARPDPDYPFLSGDYYDVDQPAFLSVKKMLLRLERLLDFPCSTTLWVKVEGLPRHITPAVQNGSVHRYYRLGMEMMECPDEMTICFESGSPSVVPSEWPGQMCTVLAPVFDSVGEVAGVVELSALDPQSPHSSLAGFQAR